MNFNDLTEEQKARARAAESTEDILALVEEEGYELNDDELEAISGGWAPSVCTNNTDNHS